MVLQASYLGVMIFLPVAEKLMLKARRYKRGWIVVPLFSKDRRSLKLISQRTGLGCAIGSSHFP